MSRGARGTRPAVFIDEDSALLTHTPDGPDAPPCLRPHAEAALTALAAHGYALVLLCSQADRLLSRWSMQGLMRQQRLLTQVLEHQAEAGITDVMACVHRPGANGKPVCQCRLPRPGLLLEAARLHGLALDRCWLIAGSKRGRRAARRAGCRSVTLGSGRKADTDDLLQAAALILRRQDPVNGMVLS